MSRVSTEDDEVLRELIQALADWFENPTDTTLATKFADEVEDNLTGG